MFTAMAVQTHCGGSSTAPVAAAALAVFVSELGGGALHPCLLRLLRRLFVVLVTWRQHHVSLAPCHFIGGTRPYEVEHHTDKHHPG